MEVLDSLTAIWLDSSSSDERWLELDSSSIDRELPEEAPSAAAAARGLPVSAGAAAAAPFRCFPATKSLSSR